MGNKGQEKARETVREKHQTRSQTVAREHRGWLFLYEIDVIQARMVYDGRVSGRRSPSYPINCEDYDRILDAVLELKERHGI